MRVPSEDKGRIAFCIIISPCASVCTAGPDGPAGRARLVGTCGIGEIAPCTAGPDGPGGKARLVEDIGDVALEVVDGRASALTGVASSMFSFMIASDFRFAPGPVSMPARLNASSKGFERGGRVDTTEVDRAIGGLDKALLTELAGEAGAEANRHCVTGNG